MSEQPGLSSLLSSSRFVPWLILALVALSSIGFTFRRHRLGDNVLSRLITVERLIETGSMAHNGTRFPLSIDSIKVKDKIYSSKPANLSLFLAAQAWVLKKLTGFQFYEYQRFYLWMLVLGTQVIPFLVMIWVAFLLVRRFTDDIQVQSTFLLAMTFGSLPLGYAVTLNNHLPGAVCLFLAFALFVLIQRDEVDRWYHYALLGFLGSLGTSFDLPGGIFPALFSGMLLLSPKRWKVGWVVLGALPPVALLFWSNYAVSGSIKPFYMQGHLYRYEGSYWVELGTRASQNLLRRDSKGMYLFQSLLGHHGLFSLTPLFFLVPYALWLAFKEKWQLRREVVAVLLGCLVIMAFIFYRTANYGGICVGMRWFVVFMPMLMFTLLPMFQKLPEKKGLRRLTFVLLAISSLSVLELLNSSVFSTSIWEEFIFIQTGIDAAVY